MAPILECSGLQKKYGSKTALNGIDLALEPGRITGLLGPNGSGKSTLLKLSCGLLTPTAGMVRVAGHVPGIESKKVVSYLPERGYFPRHMQASEAIRMFATFYDDFDQPRALSMLHDLGINEKDTLASMSKGTQEKVHLILVMSRRARLYLLDEPIGGVDPAARDYILHTILGNYSEDSSVVISTHLIADVEPILDDIVFMNQGTIALTSSVDAIREEKGMSVDALFREVFKC